MGGEEGAEGGEGNAAEGGAGGDEQAGGSSSSTAGAGADAATANRNFLRMRIEQEVTIDQPDLAFYGSMNLNQAIDVTAEREEEERNRPPAAEREPIVVRDSDPFKLTKENSMERLMIDPVMQKALEVKILDASARVDGEAEMRLFMINTMFNIYASNFIQIRI